MQIIINTAGYFFKELEDLESLKSCIYNKCADLKLLGSVLVTPEGVNIMLAGRPKSIEAIQEFFNSFFDVSIYFKDSTSNSYPFNRLLVKVKKETIAFGIDGIDPEAKPAPYVSPERLKAWLDQGHDDEGREIILLDTRNDYEIQLGTFKDAIHFNIRHFRLFPEMAKSLPLETFTGKTLVTFCTGGIRCEKAAPYMIMLGCESVYQLEGGILAYFETCSDAHWVGECFVFDNRVALKPDLSESETIQCYACRMPVTPEQSVSPAYQFGQSCPMCLD